MPITSTAGATVAYPATGNTGQVAALQKQLVAIQKQVTQESQSSDDPKTKQLKIAAYELQMQQISSEIQQIQARAAKATAAQPQPDQAKTAKHKKHAHPALTAAAENIADPTSTSVELDTVA